MNYSDPHSKRHNGIAAMILAALLAGCAPLPPKDAAPNLGAPQPADFIHLNPAPWPAADWWKQFSDAQLDTLIEQALANSPSMSIAQARIKQATAISAATAAAGGANLAANAEISRQLYSENFIYPPPLAGSFDTSGLLHLDFSYDFDFWGHNRSALEAALGQRAAAQADASASAASLSAAVAKAYFQWQALNARVALIQAIESDRNTLVRLEAQRVKAGIGAGSNVQPLLADAAAPHQVLAQLETLRSQAFYQLKSLVGGVHNFPELKFVDLPAASAGVPPDLPLDLLARRPDVAAARDRVQASFKDVDSARAAFYPDISIGAFLGLNSLEMGKLLHSSSLEMGATPAIHLPIFDAGRLRANLDMRRADVQMAVAQYDQSVQIAVAEVNDAAVRLDGAERERPSLEKQQQARRRDLDAANLRVKAGLADHREALRTQLGLLALQDQELNLHVQALTAQIDLIKALGGGYQDRQTARNDR
jgi:multidrug efflux system outer membrane protein